MIGLLLLVVLVLAVCSPKEEMPAEIPQEAAVEAEPAEEAVEPPAEEELAEDTMAENSMEAEESEMTAEIDVEALITEKVAGNHDLERIFNADKTREEWNKTLDRIIGYGAEISEEEKEIIIGYLLSK
ncbi:MAG: hypothetical protein K8R77_05610 [Anaerolineaceae bacterium]|nr:hypothetical protein [Anaerolineaceae bacterium]